MLAYSGAIKKRLTLRSFFGVQLVLFTVLLCVLATVRVWWVVVIMFIIINAFQWGLSRIDEGFQLGIIQSSKFKATLLSAGSQIEQAVTAGLSFGIGYIVERSSYQNGFLYLGIGFLVVLVPLYVYIGRRAKKGAY
ncbi:MAG: hypothetical protein A2666_00875 [Parcubacteria group bacterium RIFCSPHIGHO2_01_FULL_47_10b]|nr:MAG: hypothetical protein A2666_00875 [Parcubacteria group bacterium RIFCSPHIGHO2_01_FULL_47_10b]